MVNALFIWLGLVFACLFGYFIGHAFGYSSGFDSGYDKRLTEERINLCNKQKERWR